MSYYSNWKCNSYGLHGSGKEYGYQDIKKYFEIDGSETVYCKKDFLEYKAGNYYDISASAVLNGREYGFVILIR